MALSDVWGDQMQIKRKKSGRVLLFCYTHGSLETVLHTGRDTWGSTRSIRRPGRGELWEEPLLWFQWEGTGKAG